MPDVVEFEIDIVFVEFERVDIDFEIEMGDNGLHFARGVTQDSICRAEAASFRENQQIIALISWAWCGQIVARQPTCRRAKCRFRLPESAKPRAARRLRPNRLRRCESALTGGVKAARQVR